MKYNAPVGLTYYSIFSGASLGFEKLSFFNQLSTTLPNKYIWLLSAADGSNTTNRFSLYKKLFSFLLWTPGRMFPKKKKILMQTRSGEFHSVSCSTIFLFELPINKIVTMPVERKDWHQEKIQSTGMMRCSKKQQGSMWLFNKSLLYIRKLLVAVFLHFEF